MLRTFLYISASLTLLIGPGFAAPVAVNDAYNTNEDTLLTVGGGITAIFSATFDSTNLAAGTWLYLDKIKNNQAGQTAEGYPLDGTGLDWKSLNYNTATSTNGTTPYVWGSGALPLVGGVIDAVPGATAVLTGMNSTASTVTTYLFRKVITVDAATAAVANWTLHAVADDGAIFYLNGVEIGRLGMDSATWQPAGALSTLTGPAASGNEITYTDIAANLAGVLVAGQNVLAVEVHQGYSSGTYGSSDIGIDMTLTPAGGGTQGFVYADNTFGTTAGDAYASGNVPTDFGNPGTSLNVSMSRPINQSVNISGGWSRDFTLAAVGNVQVRLDARLRMIGGFEAGEFGQAIVAVDGVRYGPVGTAPNLSLIQTFGQGNGVNEVPNAWQSFTIDIPNLAAGLHTITVGGFVNRPTDNIENTQVYFDNITVSVPSAGGGVLANDTGGAISATLVSGPATGTLNFQSTGGFTYTPAANYNGPVSFTYTASDGTTNSNVGTVNITVSAVNDAPIGVGESYTTARNVPLVVPAGTGVLVNDSDIDTPQPSLAAVLAANAQNGSVTLNANGSFTYTPTTDYFGADNFSYRVSDGALQSGLVTVNITVTSMGPPTGVADSYTLVRNSSLVVAQTTVGTASDEVIPYLAPAWKYLDNGTNQGTAWKDVGFNDAAWASGPAELGYITGGGQATTVSYGPDAANKYITTYFRKKFTVSELHRVTGVEVVLKYDDAGIVYINGTQIAITPGLTTGAAYNAYSTVSVSGSAGLFQTANLIVPASALVEGENTIAVEIHQASAASSDIIMDLRLRLTKTVYAGVLANDFDNESDPFTAALVTNPTHGSLTLNPDGTFTYTPTAGYTGTDSFVYRAVDATGPSANTTATLTIIAGPNQPPVVVADSYNATEDTTLTVAAAQGVLANDSDGEGDSFTAELVAGPIASQGTLTLNANGSFVFTPTANFFGAAGFTYRARDAANAVSTTASVTINVASVNDVPVGVADNYSTDPGVTLNVAAAGVLANDTDADGNALTAGLVTGLSPANAGTLTLNANGSFNYIPAVGFTGTTTFVYRANDGTVSSANTTVTIRLNARPVANNDTYAATEDVALTVNATGVLGNDTDAENDPLTAILVTAPNAAQGSVTLNANGSFVFTPALNFNGAATFTYKVNDGSRDSVANATVTVNVAAVNDAPVGVANSYVTPVNTSLTVLAATGVLANDTDTEGDALTAVVVAQPAHGTLTLNVDGSLFFVPTTGYIGLDSFTYRASDGALQSAITTVNLQIGIDPKVVIINEIMYHPASNNDLEEYIELYNSGTGPMDLTGWQFTKGVDFIFPSVTIPAGGYLVVAANVAAFNAAYGSVPLIVGGWTGSLANSGETIRLQFPDSTAQDGLSEVDKVDYSKEGDWGLRRAFTDTETGWEWQTRSDGFGDSLELINPALTNSNGQNWTRREVAAAGNQRTPGAQNTDIALTPTLNSAPLISSVKHRPQIPNETQTVNVTAKLTDELTTGLSGAVFYRTWTPSQSTAGGNFSQIAMFDDGLHGDGLANDGEFGATLPAQTLNTIVEFYIRSTDSGSRVRTWPAPTTNAGAQGANCLYQVDTESWTGRQPMYRLISAGLDEYEFAPARWNQNSNAAINVTFISTQGTDIDVHYQSSIRVRGAGSRGNIPRNWKIDWVADDKFNGQRGGNLNIAYPYLQYLGAQLMKQANLPHEGATPVQVRLNRTNYAGNTGNNVKYGYGMYVHMQPIGESTYTAQNFSTDPGGNVYKKIRGSATNFTVRSVAGGGANGAAYVTDGWEKQTNSSVNIWDDLHSWMQTITTSYTEATLEPKLDIDQWCRALAMATILNDAETNISSGANDDYGLYFGEIDTRAKLLIHDYDTILGGGDTVTTANANNIYSMTDPSFAAGNSEVLVQMTNFYSDPQINQRLKAQFFDLLNTILLPANFDATVDAQLTDWGSPTAGTLPAASRQAFKDYLAARRTYILGQITGTFSAACSLGVTSGFPTTTTATATGLSGTVNSVTTRKVTVNGISVTLNNYNGGAAGSGTWTAGSAVTLVPGINQVVVRALGAGDVVLNSQTFEIVYDDASVQNVAAISGNTVWTAAGGPYRITASLSVDNETLSIEPGTTVYVDSGMSINVTGTGRVLAEGTAALPIRISKQPSASGTWNGFFLDEAAQESRFVHVIIADNGITAIAAQTGSRVVVDNVTFRNAAVAFLSFGDSSFAVSNTTFPDSTAAFQPISASGSLAGGEAVIRDCVFGKTLGANASVTFSNMKRPGPIAQLLRNTFNGSQADIAVFNGCDAWVEGNTFLHAHKNSTAVKASAIAGGAFATVKSNVTILRNLIYDCDHAVTMREGNAAAVIQNTIARITNTGGTDTGSGVFNFANTTETPGSGLVAEANIIWDTAALTRTYNSAVTMLNLDNNILPVTWTGSGTDNVVADPMLGLASIITPGTATAAQVAAAFIPDANSPAIARGVLGVADRGALIPPGILVAGAPGSPTPLTNALLMFGPSGGFGSFAAYGYTHYKAAVDSGAYGAETPASSALALTGLSTGVHTVSILGKNDAGIWQTTPTVVGWTVNPAAITVQISEILASNVNAYPVGATRPDMIELYNYGTLAVNLANMSVSDNPALPRKFVFPTGTTIPAGGYLVLLGDAPNANPGIHINFGLDADGDSFALYPQNAVIGTVPVDSVSFGSQLNDFSIGRAGLSRAWTLTTPSPLAGNTAVVLGTNSGLKINEWCGSNDFIISSDFLELYNPTGLPVALGGMLLSADLQVAAQHTIAPLSYIAAGGFVKFVADSDPAAGPNHLSWGISKFRESMRLLTSGAVLIDQVVSGPQRADISEGRSTDGSTTLTFFTLPTPGYSNGTVLTTQQQLLDNLRITELMYNPSGGTTAPEFVELQNTSSVLTLNIGGVKFSNGIDFTFPTDTMLLPGQFIVITSNPSGFATAYGFQAFNHNLGAYGGKLADGGERVRIEIGGYALGILDFSYSSAWYPSANASGASIEIINPLADRATWDVKESWRATAPNPGLEGIFGVVAGDDIVISLPATASLSGVLSYGTQNPASVTTAWTKVNGPGTVTFSAPTSLETTASFSLPGTYTLRLAATGTSTVVDTVIVSVDEDYSNWATRVIGTNTAINGLTHDADKDGLVNLLEYAFGTNPTLPTAPLLVGFNSGGLFAVSFTRSSTANVAFAIEVADTVFGPWTSDTIVTNLQSDNGILQTWVGYDTRPISANAQRFIRARVVAQ